MTTAVSTFYRVQLDSPRLHAGESLRGTITLVQPRFPESVYAQWYTEGKGTPDEGLPLRANLTLCATEQCSFEVRLPADSPRTYDGKIVKLRWRLVVNSGAGPTHAEFELLAPRTGRDSPYRDTSE